MRGGRSGLPSSCAGFPNLAKPSSTSPMTGLRSARSRRASAVSALLRGDRRIAPEQSGRRLDLVAGGGG
ncbi:hypothetical protein HMPREF0972_01029 [Actinomyces sp. oral taxon 848 str. F0332]|nr:hypothetical protein HMPREF0972_01029 [Actinomyces sp. oral taxon 848 str. F0332]